MDDVTMTDDGLIVSVEGETDAGSEFVDGYLRGLLSVIDYGRITISRECADEFAREAREAGLSVSR